MADRWVAPPGWRGRWDWELPPLGASGGPVRLHVTQGPQGDYQVALIGHAPLSAPDAAGARDAATAELRTWLAATLAALGDAP